MAQSPCWRTLGLPVSPAPSLLHQQDHDRLVWRLSESFRLFSREKKEKKKKRAVQKVMYQIKKLMGNRSGCKRKKKSGEKCHTQERKSTVQVRQKLARERRHLFQTGCVVFYVFSAS